jgi:two-component system phosphate regulon sensor histidine kinase PhoR
MKNKGLFWYVFIPLVFLVGISILLVSQFAVRNFQESHFERIQQDLYWRSLLVQQHFKGVGSDKSDINIHKLVQDMSQKSGCRITVVDSLGLVLADSDGELEKMDNHSNRPEIQDAWRVGNGFATRFSGTLKKDMFYMARKTTGINGASYILRTSISTDPVQNMIWDKQQELWGINVLLILLAIGISWAVSKYISFPLKNIEKDARIISQGSLEHTLSIEGSKEVASLARTINEMAKRLGRRMNTIQQQRSELDALFLNMSEGVFGVDLRGEIFAINPSGADILQSTTQQSLGKNLTEIVDNQELKGLLTQALKGQNFQQEDIHILGEKQDTYYHANGSPLRDANGKVFGALIVLNDVTKLIRLESLRKEFVGNVSHELKTPLAAISGASEILLGGAMDKPDVAQKFITMIHKNGDRLKRIVEDLLDLSRLEQKGIANLLDSEPQPLHDVLERALSHASSHAEKKSISITTHIESNIHMAMNPTLLEQAVFNLIENATKYSEPKTEITVEVQYNHANHITTISIQDQGPGIESKHLSRLFERFYRVDKARSRDEGGTGLGLSIVKHIAQVHGGEVHVSSEVGKGSCFTLSFPGTMKKG